LKLLCLTCGRVRPAVSRVDYTAGRARLIAEHGLCGCVQVTEVITEATTEAVPEAPPEPAVAD
jgi:hypothetical protein